MPDNENDDIDAEKTEEEESYENPIEGQIQFSVVNDGDKPNKSTISSDLIRGHINTIILRTLDERDKYGYEIMDEIQKKSLGQYELKQPTLYSALKRLEKQGYITAYWKTDEVSLGGRRKYFTLTELGREFTDINRKEWEYTRTVIDTLISDKPFDFSEPAPGKVDFSVLKKATTRLPNLSSNYGGDEEDYADAESSAYETDNEDTAESEPEDESYENTDDFAEPVSAAEDSEEKSQEEDKLENKLETSDNAPEMTAESTEDVSEDISEDVSEDVSEDEEEETAENYGEDIPEDIDSKKEDDDNLNSSEDEHPKEEQMTFAEENSPEPAAPSGISADELKNWIKSAINDVLGEYVRDDENETDSEVDGEITDISSGVSDDSGKLDFDMSLFDAPNELEDEPPSPVYENEPNEEYYEPQQLDISDIIRDVVREVLVQEGGLTQQPMYPPESATSQGYFSPQPSYEGFGGPPEYAETVNEVYPEAQPEESPLFTSRAANLYDDEAERKKEAEAEKAREQVHENFVNFVSQKPAPPKEDINPAAADIDTEDLMYSSQSEAERNYTDIIYGMYAQTVNYPQTKPEAAQPQSQPPQPQQRQRPATYITKKADDDGLKVYTAEEQATSAYKHSGPYNVGMTVFKASLIPALYIVIIAVMGYIFHDSLGIGYVYPSVYLIIGMVLLIVCASFALAGYRRDAVRPITHGYIGITIVLTVIAILFICILSLAIDTDYQSTASVVVKMVLPSLATLAAPIYVIGYYLMSCSRKIES